MMGFMEGAKDTKKYTDDVYKTMKELYEEYCNTEEELILISKQMGNLLLN